jgi:hypothetical protein
MHGLCMLFEIDRGQFLFASKRLVFFVEKSFVRLDINSIDVNSLTFRSHSSTPRWLMCNDVSRCKQVAGAITDSLPRNLARFVAYVRKIALNKQTVDLLEPLTDGVASVIDDGCAVRGSTETESK